MTATTLINESAERFQLFLQRNGKTPEDLAAICLVGGSSRLTVVNRVLGNRFGRPVCTHGDPKAVTALGALSDLQPQTTQTAAAPPDSPSSDQRPEQIAETQQWRNETQGFLEGVAAMPDLLWPPGISDPSGPPPGEAGKETTAPPARVTKSPDAVQEPAPPQDPVSPRKPIGEQRQHPASQAQTPPVIPSTAANENKTNLHGESGAQSATAYESFLQQGRNWSQGFKRRRRRHGESSHNPAWTPTDEVFIDPVSNQVMRVWIDPDSGDRHYVAEPSA